MRRYSSERPFQLVAIVLLSVCALLAALPFLLVLLCSFAEEGELLQHGYRFVIWKWSTYAYRYLFRYQGWQVLRAYGVTVIAMACGTALHLLLAPLLAWPLARRDFRRGRAMTALVVFPLALSGGTFPWYIVWTQLFHIKNTIWALVLPNLVLTPWQILLYRQYFRVNVSREFVRAAQLDGAGEWAVYWKIALPAAAPVLATVGLLVALSYCGDWFNGLYYITDRHLFNFQSWLFWEAFRIEPLVSLSAPPEPGSIYDRPKTALRMAKCVLGMLPFLLLLPAFSRAYTRVIRLGTVKT